MQKKRKIRKTDLILAGSVLAVLLLSLLCFGAWRWLANLLPSQKEAERWQGDGEMAFSQISCFLPADQQIELSDVNTFRNAMMAKLKGASLDVTGEQQLMLDAWSTKAKLYTAGQHGRGEAKVIAVGGSYFDFHPLRLINGDYIRQTDLMHDRILLGEDVAWLLFGGTDLQGMTMKLNGVPFMVAGVVQQEQDFASKKAESDGMDLYMSYDALLDLNKDAKINCYEMVLAEPVRGFALTAAKDKFPVKEGEILCNTTRYEYGKLMDLMIHYGSRSAQTTGAVLPYWENAARMTEDWAALFCMLGTLLALYPTVMIVWWLIIGYRIGKVKMEDEYLPEWKEKAEEAVRVRQRKRWERIQGAHEK